LGLCDLVLRQRELSLFLKRVNLVQGSVTLTFNLDLGQRYTLPNPFTADIQFQCGGALGDRHPILTALLVIFQAIAPELQFLRLGELAQGILLLVFVFFHSELGVIGGHVAEFSGVLLVLAFLAVLAVLEQASSALATLAGAGGGRTLGEQVPYFGAGRRAFGLHVAKRGSPSHLRGYGHFLHTIHGTREVASQCPCHRLSYCNDWLSYRNDRRV
jgi:hypothetical protein